MYIPIKGFVLFSLCFVLATSMDTHRTKNQEKINAINKHTKRQVPLSYDFGFMDYAAYDYYDWVCDATLDTCQLCDVLTGSCCDPKANDNCFLPDSCANNPCLSGGTCVTTRTRDNYPDFVCVCNRGLTGKYCQLVDDFTPPLVVPVPTAVPAPGRVNPVVAPPLSRPQTPQPGAMPGQMGMGPLGGLTGMGMGGMNQASQVLGGMNAMSGLGAMGMGGMGIGGMNGMMGGLGGMGGMSGMGGMGGMGGMSGMGGGQSGSSSQGGGFFGNRAGAGGFGAQGMGGQGMGGLGMGGMNGIGMGGMGMGGMGMGGMGMGGMGMGGMRGMGGMMG